MFFYLFVYFFAASSGVPQGSHLVMLEILFNWWINLFLPYLMDASYYFLL
jgi:hypothetical protein